LQGVPELEERARALVALVDGREQAYIDAVMAVNGFCAEFQGDMEAKVRGANAAERLSRSWWLRARRQHQVAAANAGAAYDPSGIDPVGLLLR
jgi:hypothetical protein